MNYFVFFENIFVSIYCFFVCFIRLLNILYIVCSLFATHSCFSTLFLEAVCFTLSLSFSLARFLSHFYLNPVPSDSCSFSSASCCVFFPFSILYCLFEGIYFLVLLFNLLCISIFVCLLLFQKVKHLSPIFHLFLLPFKYHLLSFAFSVFQFQLSFSSCRKAPFFVTSSSRFRVCLCACLWQSELNFGLLPFFRVCVYVYVCLCVCG